MYYNPAVMENSAVLSQSEKCTLFDFGKDAFGRLIVELELSQAQTIRISQGECLADGVLDKAPGGFRSYYTAEFALTAGSHRIALKYPLFREPAPGRVHFCMPPEDNEIMPFRYAEVCGEAANIRCSREAFYGNFNDEAADFKSSDPALNTLWDFCKYSIKATNAFDCFVDGHRERLPYEGDTYINQLGYFCCDNDYDKARRTIDHLLTYPTWPIEYRLVMPVIVRDYILYSGDKESLGKWKEALERSLFPGLYTPEGLLPEKFDNICNHENIRAIVDWPLRERDNCEFGTLMTVPNSYLYGAFMVMGELYGDEEYFKKAAAVKAVIRFKLMKNGIFVDNAESEHTALHSVIYPIVFDVAEKSDYPVLTKFLAEKDMVCSVFGAQFFLESCFKCNMVDKALSLLRDSGDRSWLGMLKYGTTITMEAWSNETKPNQDWNHAWGAAPANLIPRFVCGIRPLAAGFSKFIVAPQAGDIAEFYYRQPTPKGAVILEYDSNSGCTVTLPDGEKKVVPVGQSCIFEM